MTNRELETKLETLVQKEREITLEILRLILEVERRGLHLPFRNLQNYLVKKYKYSYPAANGRVQAARLLKSVPRAEEKILTGDLNLSTMAQTQTVFNRVDVSEEEKAEVVEKMSGKSCQENEKILATLFPEEAPVKESFRRVNAEDSRLSILLEKEGRAALERVKELLSHSYSGASWAEIVTFLALDYVKRKDPLARSKTDGEKKSKAAVKRQALQRAEGQCEYTNPETNERCRSRYRVQVDHIIPTARGGTDELENYRCLCQPHNLLEAQRILGKETMDPYWPKH